MISPVEGLSILVVDDQEGIRKLLRRVLVSAGYDVITASSGIEALELTKTAPAVSLAFIDITMPLMDGITLTQKLRAIDPELHIVLMSGFDMDDVLASSPVIEPPPQFLEKPFKLDQLLHAVEAAIGR